MQNTKLYRFGVFKKQKYSKHRPCQFSKLFGKIEHILIFDIHFNKSIYCIILCYILGIK